MNRPTIGLALGAGVARGWAHIGVIHRLLEAGIEPDVVAGTSIGAVVGGAHSAGKLDVLEDWARHLTGVRMLRFLDLALNSGGLIGGKRLKKILTEHMGKLDIEDLPNRFVAVTTELSTGHEIWVREGNLVDGIIASYALPGIFPPVQLNGRWLVDGAMVNPVPISVCRAYGARLVISVNLNGDVFGRNNLSDEILSESDMTASDVMQRIRENPKEALNPSAMVMRRLLGRDAGAPSIFSVMMSSIDIVQDRLNRSRMAADPSDVNIEPKLGLIGMMEFDRAEECIAEGYRAADEAIPSIMDALAILA